MHINVYDTYNHTYYYVYKNSAPDDNLDENCLVFNLKINK